MQCRLWGTLLNKQSEHVHFPSYMQHSYSVHMYSLVSFRQTAFHHPFLKLCVYKWSCFPLTVAPCWNQSAGARLCELRSIRHCIRFSLMYCTGMQLSGLYWWSFCCRLRMSPPRSKGADAGACNMHEAVGQLRSRWTRAVHFEYKCSGRVSAGCGALSRPPRAIGGVSWWPADCTKWFFPVILSTSIANRVDNTCICSAGSVGLLMKMSISVHNGT